MRKSGWKCNAINPDEFLSMGITKNMVDQILNTDGETGFAVWDDCVCEVFGGWMTVLNPWSFLVDCS